MSFRRRITIASAAAVAVAVVLASMLIYVLTSDQLHNQVDDQLSHRGRQAGVLTRALNAKGSGAAAVSRRERLRRAVEQALAPAAGGSAAGGSAGSSAHKPAAKTSTHVGNIFGNLPPGPDQVRGYQQVLNAKGTILDRSAQGVSLPVEARTRRLAERAERRSSATPMSTAPTCGSSPSRWAPGAPSSSPSRSPKSTACSAPCA